MIPAVLVGQGSVSQLFSFLQPWHLQAAALGRWGRRRTTSPAGKPQPKHQTPAAASQAVEHELPSFATQGTGVKWLQFQESLVYHALIHGSSAAAAWMAEPSLQKCWECFQLFENKLDTRRINIALFQKAKMINLPEQIQISDAESDWGKKKSEIYIGKQRKICYSHDQSYQVCTCPRWQKPKPICVKGKCAWITDIFSWKLRLWKE